MKILAWNCRGLGNRRAVQELVEMVQAQDPMIVFFVRNMVIYGAYEMGKKSDFLLWVFYGFK